MPRKKQEKEELRQDRFLIFVDKMIRIYMNHKTKVIIATCIIIGIILASFATVSFMRSRIHKVALAYARARSVEDVQAIIDRYPRSPLAARAYFLVATTQFNLEKYEEALATYQSLLEYFPDNFLVPYVYIDAGYCCENLKKFTDAIQYYEKVSEIFPETSAALQGKVNAARCYLRAGEFTKAEKLYNEVVEKAPFSLWAREAQKALENSALSVE